MFPPTQQKQGCFFAPHSLGKTWSRYHAKIPQKTIFNAILTIAVAMVYWLITSVNVTVVLIDYAYNIYLNARMKATCGTIDMVRYTCWVGSGLLDTI